eukprot:5868431-Pyramimonas_sp.AAC.1
MMLMRRRRGLHLPGASVARPLEWATLRAAPCSLPVKFQMWDSSSLWCYVSSCVVQWFDVDRRMRFGPRSNVTSGLQIGTLNARVEWSQAEKR